MDRDEALRLLRGGEEGIKKWNREIEQGRKIPNLESANLRNANLRSANLCSANLRKAILSYANLSHADLRDAKLFRAGLFRADLNHAKLNRANLIEAHLISGTTFVHADLSGANLSDANLSEANLGHANLCDADLIGADLRGTNLNGTSLVRTRLEEARCSSTIFHDVNLSVTRGLERVRHDGPSGLSNSTIALSKARIPITFLKGCGFADWEIETAKLYQPDLRNDEVLDIQQEVFRLRSQGALQINSLFISYSHKDTEFVEAIEKRLDEKRIRFWRDVHDLKAGRLEKQIDRGMRLNPTVLLVFSKDSVKSDWVEWEVSQARKLEKELKRDVLCPVALDDSWKTCDWPGPLRRQIEDYNILDFSAWQETEFFDRQFEKLVDGLDLFYRPVKS